jgi:hypothetical protein
MDEEAQPPSDFERKKWQTEVELRRQELNIKEREEKRLAAELNIKEREENRLAIEAARSRWWNPLFIAIVGASIAAIGSIGVSWWNGRSAEKTEAIKAESARIIEMIRVGEMQLVRRNLHFLVESELVTGSTRENLKNYLARTPADQDPLLPSSSWIQPASPMTEASEISKFVCPGSAKQYWIYHYTARRAGEPTFRVILPPNWGQPIGGNDVSTREDAEKVALAACNSNQKISISDGMIVAPQSVGGTTYLIENGMKRAIPDMTTFQGLGFTWDKLVRLPEDQLNAIPTGNPIPYTTSPAPHPGSSQ